MIAAPIAFESRWRSAGDLENPSGRLIRELPEMEAALGLRTRRRRPADAEKFAACLDALLCNFAAIELAAPGHALATARRTRAKGSDVHGKTFVRTLDTLEACGLIEQTAGGWSAASSQHEVSQSRATTQLRYYMPSHLDAGCLIARPVPLLELRSEKDAAGMWTPLPMPAGVNTAALGREVSAINATLAGADITRDGAQLWVHQREQGLPYITGTRLHSLRRTFNDGTLSRGGRLVGGWWQSMSSESRLQDIRIGGMSVVELDFVAMVPRICYALCRVVWPFGDDADAAYCAGPEAPRKAWKQWTLALLSARAMLRSWPGATAADRVAFGSRFDGLTPGQARERVLAHHAGLTAAGAFGRALGMEAMRVESDIATAVLLALGARGVVALPIHDAFCVPASAAELTAQEMRLAAKRITGTEFAVEMK